MYFVHHNKNPSAAPTWAQFSCNCPSMKKSKIKYQNLAVKRNENTVKVGGYDDSLKAWEPPSYRLKSRSRLKVNHVRGQEAKKKRKRQCNWNTCDDT